MIPIDFEGSNKKYTKPKGWTDEECGDLHTLETITEQGQPLIISCWQPNKEDIEAINAGRPIWLKMISNGMCPVEVLTLNENHESNS